MKVLHVINHLDCGGAEKLVFDLTVSMRMRGLTVDVLTLQGGGLFYERLLSECPGSISSLNLVSRFDLTAVFRLVRIVRKYDVIHAHLCPSIHYVVLVSMICSLRIPVVATEHSTDNRRRRFWCLRLIDRFVFSKIDSVICISLAVQNSLMREMNAKNLRVIFNGVDINKYKQAVPLERKKISEGLVKGDTLLIMVARFAFEKDHETAISSLKELPESFKLIFVGDGPRLKICRDYATKNGLSHRTIFLGHRIDVPQLIVSCDAAIFSSKWEGFGLVAVECMAAGVPVVCSNVDGLREVVKDAGVFFECGNSAELARCIKKLFSPENFRGYKQLADRGLVRASLYGLDKTVDQTVSLYNSLLA